MFNYVTFFALVLSSSRTIALDFNPIVGYIPGSQVSDHGNIDLDQSAMEAAIVLKTDAGYAAGIAVYENGGNSKAVATVTLDEKASLIKSTRMTGTTVDGGIASVTVYEDTTDSKSLQLKYVDFLACQVGGLDSDSQNTDGCLVLTGTITDGTTTLDYSGIENNNKRTLKGSDNSMKSTSNKKPNRKTKKPTRKTKKPTRKTKKPTRKNKKPTRKTKKPTKMPTRKNKKPTRKTKKPTKMPEKYKKKKD